jgi:transketolase
MNIKQLEIKANQIRQDLIKMLVEAGSGHSAGPLDLADIFTALYFGDLLKYRIDMPDWADRDRLVLSCGHTCPIFYTTLIHAGLLRQDEFLTLRKLDTRLQGHPHHEQSYPNKELYHPNTPGVENSAGPLGQGMSVGVGMALAGKMGSKKWRVYLIGSDGELNEGQTWEAIMFAGNRKLSNLTYIIDRNNIQIDGYTEHVNGLEPLYDKLKAFNFHVIEIDGNSIDQIIAAVKESWTILDKPTAILANTIPGKGVEYMTGDFEWHGKPPSKEQGEEAIKELRTLQGKILSEHE